MWASDTSSSPTSDSVLMNVASYFPSASVTALVWPAFTRKSTLSQHLVVLEHRAEPLLAAALHGAGCRLRHPGGAQREEPGDAKGSGARRRTFNLVAGDGGQRQPAEPRVDNTHALTSE